MIAAIDAENFSCKTSSQIDFSGFGWRISKLWWNWLGYFFRREWKRREMRWKRVVDTRNYYFCHWFRRYFFLSILGTVCFSFLFRFHRNLVRSENRKVCQARKRARCKTQIAGNRPDQEKSFFVSLNVVLASFAYHQLNNNNNTTTNKAKTKTLVGTLKLYRRCANTYRSKKNIGGMLQKYRYDF